MRRTNLAYPNIENLKKQAKTALKKFSRNDASVCDLLRLLHRFAGKRDSEILSSDLALHEVQYALAIRYGFSSWGNLKHSIDSQRAKENQTLSADKPSLDTRIDNTKNSPHGKLRRLSELLIRIAGKEITARITHGLVLPNRSASSATKSKWVRTVIERMDSLLPEAQRKEIMESRRCRPPKMLILKDQEIWHQSEDLADFANRKSPSWGGDGIRADRNSLRLRISQGRCHCLLQGSRDVPIGKTHCRCCAGHIRGFFEPVFGMAMDVDPLTTVISGDSECWFVAYVGGRENLDGPAIRPAIRETPKVPTPLRTKVIPFPVRLPISAKRVTALKAIHAAITAIVTASTAKSPAEQISMKNARSRMLASLWCIACSSELKNGMLWTETRHTRGKGLLMPEPQGSRELSVYCIPGLHVTVNVLMQKSPKQWEVKASMDHPLGLRMLQRYSEVLCTRHGASKKAFESFCHGDMRVWEDSNSSLVL